MPILVTSDSRTFLDYANKYEYVYTIPGNIRHMDYSKEKTDIMIDMKSYVDFFMVANADIIHLCNISPLYRSSFSEVASYVYNRPFVELKKDYIQKESWEYF